MSTPSIDDAVSAVAEEGELVSGYIAFVEVANADGTYSIRVYTDGQSTVWKLEGLVQHALNNGYHDPSEEEDED